MLSESVSLKNSGASLAEVHDFVVNTLNGIDHLSVEYYQIVDATTMQPITAWSDSTQPVGCVTVYDGEVRLIDNIKY